MDNKIGVKRKSMTTNGAFSLAAKVLAMMVPMIVYPFIMRVLGAESYGKVIYAESVASYFSLLAVLGITTFAQRECAVARDNPDTMRRVASRVFALNLIMTLFSLAIYLSLVFFIPSFQAERTLHLIFACWIIGSGLSMGWLYSSQERFDLISIREIIAKFIYLVLCFSLIKSNDSYIIFAVVVVVSDTVFSMIWNVSGVLRGECGVIPNLKYSSGFTEYIRPVTYLALLTIGSKLFTDFDVMMIKWFSSNDSDTAVGLYNSAIILPKALDSILMTISAVITPQLFIACRQGEEERVKALMNKTSNVLSLVAIPAIVTCLFFSREMMWLFAGEEYLPAAPVLQVYSFIIIGVLVITLAGTRMYIARRKEHKLFIILIFGAILNIILNYFFIKAWGILGAAIATLTAYALVMTIELTLENTWHYIFSKDKIKYVLAGLGIFGAFTIVNYFFSFNPAIKLVCSIGFAGVIYLFLLLILKESTVMHSIEIIKQVINNYNN